LTKIRVLDDTDAPPAVRVPANTIINDALITEGGDAWYFNPITGEDWMSFEGDFEVVGG
jgi:hypothetical protein